MCFGTFLSFQWDLLLLETGWLAALYAPLFDCSASNLLADSPSARMLVGFSLFKLMLLSGVVKVQAGCSTWQNLTAMEYDFLKWLHSRV